MRKLPKPKSDLRAIALTSLARREHSRLELTRKLSAKGFAIQAIEEGLDALEVEHLLSDTRFTESYVHARRQRGFGPLRITEELKQRGIDEALIQGVFESFSEGDWHDLAKAQYIKRFGECSPSNYKERTRRARFLQGRGFSNDIIFRVIDEREER